MRIAYLCHRIPYPPNKGDKIRAFHQLKALGKSHEIDLFTLADEHGDLEYRSALLPYCRTITVAEVSPTLNRLKALPYLATTIPLTLPYFRSAVLYRKVRRALDSRSYDRIFVYSSSMSQYVEEVHGIPVLTDLVDVDSNKWLQYASFAGFPFSIIYRRESWCLQRYERWICTNSQHVIVTTDHERQLVAQISSRAIVTVIQNGVDTTYFDPDSVAAERSCPTAVFTGDMGYFPNIDAVTYFAKQVLPIIQRELPEAQFLIVGRNPSGAVRALSRMKGVHVTGSVPDVRMYLARSHVSVAPFMIAAGIQNKVLEAMAFGLPVVATVRTVQGVSRALTEVIDVANDPEEMASHVVHLMRDQELARRRGAESRALVRRECCWSMHGNLLHQLLNAPSGPSQPPLAANLSFAGEPTP
jgi:sugar transferase (PEP-CTERM/EpsH1 system associated)